jgi:hypothetical protein
MPSHRQCPGAIIAGITGTLDVLGGWAEEQSSQTPNHIKN